MVEYMEGIRELRLANDRRMFVDGRREAIAKLWSIWLAKEPQLKRYPPGYFLPTVIDILEHPRTHVLINEPGERMFSKEEIIAFLDGFHGAIEEWRKEKSELLFGFVSDACRRSIGLEDESSVLASGLGWLELAMVVFSCIGFDRTVHLTAQVCDDPTLPWNPDSTDPIALRSPESGYKLQEYNCMWFPECLHHACCKARAPTWDDRQFRHEMYLGINRLKVNETTWLRRAAWSAETLRFNAKASVVMKHVLQACGLPLTTRTKDLDELSPRLVCLKCTHGHRCDGERQVVVRTWRDTVRADLFSSPNPKVLALRYVQLIALARRSSTLCKCTGGLIPSASSGYPTRMSKFPVVSRRLSGAAEIFPHGRLLGR